VDFEVDYSTDIDLFGGGETLDLRLLGAYLEERSATDSMGNKTEYKGALLPSEGGGDLMNSAPEWVIHLSGKYQRGPFGLYMQVRYRDDVLMDRNRNFNGSSTQWDVYDNVLDAEILVDARVNYMFNIAGGNLNLFATINNLLDKDPEERLYYVASSFFFNTTTNGVFGDLRGRRYVVGVRYEYNF
jgi:outer membrane receptor protein involved in Fe transport